MRSYWLYAALILSAALCALQLWALEDFLYWKYAWFDIPMHFLGGLALGSFLIAFIHGWKPRLYVVLLALLIIGWEVFEFVFGLPRESNYGFDTVIDLVLGSLGGLLVYLIARKTLWR